MHNPAYTREWLMRQLPQKGLGPCAKQTVVAVIETADGRTFAGTNACRNPQNVCPRDLAGFKTGEGYELCLDVCQQTGHAEKNALEAAGKHAQGAVMRIYGHAYACAECTRQARSAGITDLIVGGGFKRLNRVRCSTRIDQAVGLEPVTP